MERKQRRDLDNNNSEEDAITDNVLLAATIPIDPEMLDIEDPRRARIVAQRQKVYQARRVNKPKRIKKITKRVSMNEVHDQVSRSSNVVLGAEERKEAEASSSDQEHVGEEENSSAVSEDNEEIEDEEESGAEDEASVANENGEKIEDDDGIESSEEIEEREVQQDEQVQQQPSHQKEKINSRGRMIVKPSRDAEPITHSSTWRRKNWK